MINSFFKSITLIIIVLLIWSCTPKTGQVVQQPTPAKEEIGMPPMAEPNQETKAQKVPGIPIDDKVRIGKLDNGMYYYIRANQKPEDRAELRLAVSVGSINEDDDQQGLAHFVEHMAFNGTKNFEKSELVDYLQSVGTRFGADLNAYTSFDETVYMLQVRTDSQELFDKGMLILEDWAHAISFDNEEIDKERGVVESELRSGLNANQRMENQYLPTIFKNSKYAERLPIGKREIINNAEYDALKRFYHDWYRPDLMALIVVGDIDVDKIEADIKSRFSPLSNPDSPRERETFGFPDHEETLISICKDKEATITTARILYKHDHIKILTLEDYRASLVRSLYNRILNDRLSELRQSANPPFLYGYSGYGRQVGNLDTYTSFASAGEGKVMDGLQAVLIENARALKHGFTVSEFERSKTEMLSEVETMAKEEDKVESARLAGQYVYHFLNDNPIPSMSQRLELVKQFLPSIQLAEVNKLGSSWITEGNQVIVITGPDKEEVPLPTEADVLALINKVDNMNIEAYEDNVADIPLLAEIPKAGSVVKQMDVPEIGLTKLVLSNGVKVWLKPTDFQNDEISITAFSPGGHSIYSDEDYRSASLTSAIILQSGISDFDNIQLKKQLAGKQVQVGPFISELEEGIQGFSTVKDVETMFQLLHLYFTKPRKDEQAYQSIMTRQRQILQNLLVDPNYYFSDRATKVKYNNHPRRGIPTVEDLDQVSLDKIMEVYQDRFADASDFHFIFVGNFTNESILPLILTYLGSLPNTDREESWKDVHANYIKGKHTDRFSYGKAPKAQVDITYHGDFDWDVRESRFQFGALLEVMRNRLRESMREDQGGVYGVRVGGSVSKYPTERYYMNISFNAEPDEVDSLIATAKKDVEIIMKEGPKEEDIQKVLEIQRQSRIKNLKENNYWIYALRRHATYDLNPVNILLEKYETLLDGLTTEDVRNMAKQIFDTENIIEIVMLPGEGE